jgi:RHS repeat-associated protein
LNQYPSVTLAGQSAPPASGHDCLNNAQALSYDCNGNLTNDGNFAFAYDPENRLLSAVKTGRSVAFAYDPLGRRTTKTVSGDMTGTTYFLDSRDDEIADYDGSGNLLRRYIPGPGVDQPIAMVTCSGSNCSTATKTFFHQDKSGSVIAMSDVNGNLTEGPYTYDAYGNGAPYSGVPFKYTGRRLDPETGLYYYRARYYSSALGRFLQTDPIGYKDDIDWYTYTGNDPTDKNDPSGKNAVCALDDQEVLYYCIDTGTGAVYTGGQAQRIYRREWPNSRTPPVYNSDQSNAPIPDKPVGVGPKPKEGKINSGPLAPQNGGTGNPDEDFEHLTGGQNHPAPPESGLPSGSRVGTNGIVIRPGTKGNGPRIDIPKKGSKPPEVLHYPPPPPPPPPPSPPQ